MSQTIINNMYLESLNHLHFNEITQSNIIIYNLPLIEDLLSNNIYPDNETANNFLKVYLDYFFEQANLKKLLMHSLEFGLGLSQKSYFEPQPFHDTLLKILPLVDNKEYYSLYFTCHHQYLQNREFDLEIKKLDYKIILPTYDFKKNSYLKHIYDELFSEFKKDILSEHIKETDKKTKIKV